MKLSALFGKEQEIYTDREAGITATDLLTKFTGLVHKLNLIIEKDENKVLYASDGSGEMTLKRFVGNRACFIWRSYDFRQDARAIFDVQD